MTLVCPACGTENPEGAVHCQGCAAALRKFTVSDPAPLERIQAFNSWHQREHPARRRRFRSSRPRTRVSARWTRVAVVVTVLAVGVIAGYFFVAGVAF